jgi:hypothetical protein
MVICSDKTINHINLFSLFSISISISIFTFAAYTQSQTSHIFLVGKLKWFASHNSIVAPSDKLQANLKTTTTSMYSVSILPAPAITTSTATAATKHHNPVHPRWYWSDLQYRELVGMYMDFVDRAESANGTSIANPHLNPALIEQAFYKFSHIAPRDCIIRKLKDCHTLEEEPYELAMNPMSAAYLHLPKAHIRHRNQWDILKIQRMIDQIAKYQHQLAHLAYIAHIAPTNDNKQTIAAIRTKIEERQRCLQLHPTRYYRPGP